MWKFDFQDGYQCTQTDTKRYALWPALRQDTENFLGMPSSMWYGDWNACVEKDLWEMNSEWFRAKKYLFGKDFLQIMGKSLLWKNWTITFTKGYRNARVSIGKCMKNDGKMSWILLL